MERLPIRALLVDPREDDAALLAATLAGASPAPIRVRRVDRLADVPRGLAEEPVDVLLVDATRPGGRDLDALRRTCLDWPDLPVLVLTPPEDEAFGLAAVEAGAQDALAKGRTTGESLARAMAYAVERQKLLAEVRALTLVDELTGLYNRRGFLTIASHQLRVAARRHEPVWLLFADLDGMKRINDAFGHAAGDGALCEAAEALKETFRESDTLGRVGGDEFAVLAAAGVRNARDRPAARLRRALAARGTRPERPFPLAMSVGVVRCVPDATTTIEQLLALADERMYAEKRARAPLRPDRVSNGGFDHGTFQTRTPARHRESAG